jgi:hypothetical protein
MQFLIITAFAQSSEKDFVGTWQLAQQSYDDHLMKAPDGYFKIFNADNTFANILTRNGKPVTTHSGTFRVDGEYCLEKTLYRIPAMINNSPLGTDFKIKFEFNRDQTQLTLSFTAVNGIAVVEIWKKQSTVI